MQRAETLQQVEADLQKAREWRDRASEYFDGVVRGAPSGSSGDENFDRIQAASAEYNQACEAVREALKRWDEVAHGNLRTGADARDAG